MEFNEIPDRYRDLRFRASEAVDKLSSIELNNIEDISFITSLLEDILNLKRLSYRIRTDDRASIPTKVAGGGAAIIGASIALEAAAVAAPIIVGAAAITGAALTGVGAIALAGIAAHRLFTANPDYEIVHFRKLKEVHLIYKK